MAEMDFFPEELVEAYRERAVNDANFGMVLALLEVAKAQTSLMLAVDRLGLNYHGVGSVPGVGEQLAMTLKDLVSTIGVER